MRDSPVERPYFDKCNHYRITKRRYIITQHTVKNKTSINKKESVHEKKLFKALSHTFAEAGRNGLPPAAEKVQSVELVRRAKHVRRTFKQRISQR